MAEGEMGMVSEELHAGNGDRLYRSWKRECMKGAIGGFCFVSRKGNI
jgi:hypothetical protein